MYISKIRIHNFKCITDLTLDLERIRGFWEIKGHVGSGKTTIGEAIIFSLFGSTVDSKSNVSLLKWGENHCEVEMWCHSNGYELNIIRHLNSVGQSPLYAYANGQRIISSSKRELQQQLEDTYYDVSKLMLETLCIISFNTFKSLSTMNTYETNRFLDQVFGMKLISEYIDKCNIYSKSLQNKLYESNIQLTAIHNQIHEYQEWLKEDHLDNMELDSLKHDLEEVRRNISSLDAQSAELKHELDTKSTPKKNMLNDINSRSKQLRKAIDSFRNGVCPTCGHPIDHHTIDQYDKDLEDLSKQYLEVKNELGVITDDYNSRYQSINSDLAKLKSRELDIHKRISRTEVYESQRSRFTSHIDKLDSDYKQLENGIGVIKDKSNAVSDLKRVLQSDIRQCIIESIIPRLNENLIKYMVELGQPYIVEFNNTFECIIRNPSIGENHIPITSLSTGQLKIVDMAIILSILDTMLSSINFNVIFLDELLSNMHEELRGRMCELLKREIVQDRTVFIITHTTIKQDIIDGSILVDYECDGSQYTIQC